jgi:hypothetical protein
MSGLSVTDVNLRLNTLLDDIKIIDERLYYSNREYKLEI